MKRTPAPARVHDRTAAFLMPVKRKKLAIVTPEGVQLDVEVANLGERAAAFLLDVALITSANILLVLVIVVGAGLGVHARGGYGHARVVFALAGLVGFLMRTLYFARFELVWQGATPGKRICGLRVIDRLGGPLLPGAVIARNVTREAEVFLPLGAFMGVGASGLGGSALALWLILLAAVPLFTGTRLRVGDMLAGTVVIAVPKRALLDDLIVGREEMVFSERQLRAYGAFELQVLEEILRRPPGAETDKLQQDVCGRICKRIEWPGPVAPVDTGRFLRQFYAAERAYLEREQLFGRMRETKEI